MKFFHFSGFHSRTEKSFLTGQSRKLFQAGIGAQPQVTRSSPRPRRNFQRPRKCFKRSTPVMSAVNCIRNRSRVGPPWHSSVRNLIRSWRASRPARRESGKRWIRPQRARYELYSSNSVMPTIAARKMPGDQYEVPSILRTAGTRYTPPLSSDTSRELFPLRKHSQSVRVDSEARRSLRPRN